MQDSEFNEQNEEIKKDGTGTVPVADTDVTETPAPAETETDRVDDADAAPGSENSANEKDTADTAAASEDTVPVFTWDFADVDKAARKKQRRGALVYAAIMTAAFLVCFGLLIWVVLTSPKTSQSGPCETVTVEKVIYVRDGESSGKLSIPEISAKVSPSVVGIAVKKTGGNGVGTGIIKTADGYILTNYHVIEDYTAIEVVTSDGKYHRAEYIGGNELSDVAIIKINADGLPAAEFGNSDELIVGETAVAIGTPGGLEYIGTVTTGIISAVDRSVRFYDDTGLLEKTMKLIQTSTQINPGNSGGPLINGDGKVIGINTYKITEDGFEGLGFAIPINGVLKIYDDILAGGAGTGGQIVKKAARLGIMGTAVTKGARFTYTVDGTEQIGKAEVAGVAVATVSDPGYDAATKLRPGDIITSINGKTVTGIEDIRLVIENMSPGDTVTIIAFRNGSEFTVDVLLGS